MSTVTLTFSEQEVRRHAGNAWDILEFIQRDYGKGLGVTEKEALTRALADVRWLAGMDEPEVQP